MRVLICGSRDWDDQWIVHRILDGVHDYEAPDFAVIEGCARGADRMAETWIESHGTEYPPDHTHFPAKWDEHPKAAGPIRNQQMLDEGKPNVVIAFSDDLTNSKGTGDMVRRAKKAGLPVYLVSRP